VEAGVLVICTDVEGVYDAYGTPDQRLIDRLTPGEALEGLADGTFPAGSMGPKVEAAATFVGHGGERAVICSLDDAPEALQGQAGTTIAAR
jgi:carbamate kinase